MTLDKDSRILLIDDSAAIRVHMRDILAGLGYGNVAEAESVDAGLQAFEEEEPDLVFVDLMMPEKSGLDFIKTALEKNPRARIVVVSALAPADEAVVVAISHGATDFVRKPVREDAVAPVLARLGPDESESVSPSYA